jgi:hypothetical protein
MPRPYYLISVLTEPATLAALLWHGLGLEEAEASGQVGIEGDRAAVERFLTLFPQATAAA